MLSERRCNKHFAYQSRRPASKRLPVGTMTSKEQSIIELGVSLRSPSHQKRTRKGTRGGDVRHDRPESFASDRKSIFRKWRPALFCRRKFRENFVECARSCAERLIDLTFSSQIPTSCNFSTDWLIRCHLAETVFSFNQRHLLECVANLNLKMIKTRQSTIHN